MSESESALPPGVYRKAGRLYHKRQVGRDSGTMEIERPVTLDKEEARIKHMDYYDYELGWIIDGYKLAWDRSTESIVQDSTESQVTAPEGVKI